MINEQSWWLYTLKLLGCKLSLKFVWNTVFKLEHPRNFIVARHKRQLHSYVETGRMDNTSHHEWTSRKSHPSHLSIGLLTVFTFHYGNYLLPFRHSFLCNSILYIFNIYNSNWNSQITIVYSQLLLPQVRIHKFALREICTYIYI